MKSIAPSIVALLPGILTASAWAAPLPQLAPVTVEGTVMEVEWNPALKVEARPGMSGTLGIDRTIPAHFFVSLADFRIRKLNAGNRADSGNAEQKTAMAWKINRYWENGQSGTADHTRPPQHLLLRLNHNDPNAIRKGMRIRVVDYSVVGDEGGTWTGYKAIEEIDCDIGTHVSIESRVECQAGVGATKP